MVFLFHSCLTYNLKLAKRIFQTTPNSNKVHRENLMTQRGIVFVYSVTRSLFWQQWNFFYSVLIKDLHVMLVNKSKMNNFSPKRELGDCKNKFQIIGFDSLEYQWKRVGVQLSFSIMFIFCLQREKKVLSEEW